MTEEQRKELERKISVMQAYLDGAEVEISLLRAPEFWETPSSFKWDWRKFNYRVKQTKPSINWDHLRDDVVAIAVDISGHGVCFTNMPNADGSRWINTGFYGYIDNFASFKPGTCYWKDSLVKRPGVGQEEPEE